jgi:outer membrane biosynthesis protein TonB
MSEHGHHDPGGHELEAINTKLLFRLLVSLSLVTFLSSVAVVQWFNSQRRELQNSLAVEGSFMLKAHDAKMAEQLSGIDRVAMDVAANPALLAAPPAPAGWIHPDDLVGGPAVAKPVEQAPEPKQPVEPKQPTPEPTPVPEEQPVPVELPAGDAPAKEEPAKDEPAKEDKKPAKEEPAKEDKKPAKEDKPAKAEDAE